MRKDAAAELSSGESVRGPERITRKSSSASPHSSANSLMPYRLMISSHHTYQMVWVAAHVHEACAIKFLKDLWHRRQEYTLMHSRLLEISLHTNLHKFISLQFLGSFQSE